MENFDFKNKKVVLLLKFAILGGAERQALGMAEYLIRNFHCNVTVIATHSNEQTIEFKKFANQCGIYEIHFFGAPSLTISSEFSLKAFKKNYRAKRYFTKMKSEVGKMSPDIIIPFLNSPSKIAALIYKKVGAKITFWHQLGLDSYLHDSLEKKAISKTPFFVANAENGLDEFKNFYHVSEKQLYCLPQYVSIKKIELDKNIIKKSFQINNDAIVIGMIAHFRSEKYHDLVLSAFSKICNDFNIHLVLLGNKDNSEETLSIYNNLLSKVSELNIQKSVSVLSGIAVEQILNLLDIGVLVSEIEGTPNVVMEYMLYELPVIATYHVGCKKLLHDSPYLIPNDESVLIDKFKDLIQNDSKRKMEGNLNKERIKNNTIENYFLSLNKIINNHL